ncbi:hypothetical protein [Polyangium jinanense]|uniref:MerC domain-containing protein n=1 Tax=Polyangium jinanense TaxID=2829994 RepID=A0A9X3XJW9_9BACT|nr:hypothetical protein [Polyangium jinanense]MDC3962269.1 MerC domain-containing protein [Polyangium jinanense]MDC3962558.1 MerC domain-containing protein [Polyangium jinanense]MDC3989416.1 MerC domain-containing protein [Polyangium jinanense]
MQPIVKVFEDNHIDAPWSHVFVFALDAVLFLVIAFCVREIRRARRAAVEADAVIKPKAPLFEGARFVAGTVELAQGESDAVRVTITQDGSEQADKNNHKTHTWVEKEREIRARPFYLRHDTGARVRVEPPEDVLLVDTLDQKEWLHPTRRKLRAELLPGERVVVEGRLHKAPDPEGIGETAGYREAATMGWMMKPSPQKGMHISTESLSRRHELRARAFFWTCVWVVFLGFVMNVPLATYRARVFLGENVVATLLGKRTYETSNGKGKKTVHRAVDVRYESPPGTARFGGLVEIDEDDGMDLPPGVKGEIWLRRVPRFPAATALGQGSSVWFHAWCVAAVIAGIAVYRAYRTHIYRRWYEGRVQEKGQGPLPPQTNERFLADDPTAFAAREKRGLARAARAAKHVEPIPMD